MSMESSGNQLDQVAGFSCVCCGSSRAGWVFRGVRDYYLPTGIMVDYARCALCGLVQQHPMPMDVAPYYVDYPVHAPRKSPLHEFMRRMVFRNLYFNPRPLASGSVLLDFGCGDGWYLDSLSRYPLQRIGYEFNPDHAGTLEKQLGVPVYADWALMEQEWGGRVDQVTMHFVVEHLTDVRGVFGHLSRMLKRGGRIYAVFPNLECREFGLFKSKWHGFDSPRHVLFPQIRHLEQMTRGAGLQVDEAGHVSFPNTSAASLAISLAGRYQHALFLMMMPAGWLWSHLDPSGTLAVSMVKTQ